MPSSPFTTFRIPRAFHPGYAPLGRRLRRRTDDARHAESLLILIVAGLVLGALLTQQFAWALLRDAVLADPFGSWALGFWASQLAVGAAFAVGAGWGFKPGMTITCTPTAVCIQPDGGSEFVVPLAAVTDARRLDARVFHRHYRRYRRTRVFVNRIEEEVVLLRTPAGPVILGLAEPDRTAFIDLLAHRQVTAERAIDDLRLTIDDRVPVGPDPAILHPFVNRQS